MSAEATAPPSRRIKELEVMVADVVVEDARHVDALSSSPATIASSKKPDTF